MAGKNMRCTDPSCRAVFTIGTAAPVGDGPKFYDWRTEPPPSPAESSAEETREDLPPPPRPKPPAPTPVFTLPATPRRSRRTWLLVGLALFVAGASMWGLALVVQSFTRAEDRLAAAAARAFADGEYGKASELYGELAARCGRSVRGAEYRFRGELAAARRLAGLVPPEPAEALAGLESLVANHAAGPFLAGHRDDLFAAASKTVGDFLAEARGRLPADAPGAEQRVELARRAAAFALRYAPTDADPAALKADVDAVAAEIERRKAVERARKEVFLLLTAARPDLESARELIRRAGFTADPEIRAAWIKAEATLRGLVAYTPQNRPAAPGGPITTAGLLPGPAATGAGPRVPALAHGLLVAVDARTGRPAWADRIGLDATAPVVIVPGPEPRWLVVTDDPPSLQLRDPATGRAVWVQPLEQRAVGGPVVVRGKAYLALGGISGTIAEIDLATGAWAGSFTTGQPLAGGVTAHPRLPRIFVPARAQQIYVLDVQPEDAGPPRCWATLTTGHAAGTVRRPPELIPLPDGGLALALERPEAGLDSALELFRVPDAADAPLTPLGRGRVRGAVGDGFASHGDRLAVVSDRGDLAVWAVRLPASSDTPLFEVAEAAQSAGERTNGFAVWDGDRLIALVGGRLRQWRAVVDRARGQGLAVGWSFPEPLGTALEPPLLIDGVLYCVTAELQPARTLLTAVKAASGELVWQRTLGLAPAAAGAIPGGVVAVDRRGGMSVIGATEPPAGGWAFVGRDIAGPVSGLVGEPTLAGPDALLATADGLVWRRLNPDATVTERRFSLPSRVAGSGAVGPGAVVLPLANGQLVRVAESGRVVVGPTWRAPTASPDVGAIVRWWHDDIWLVADGGRRLMTLRWAESGEYDLRVAQAHERPLRVLTEPILIPGEPRRVAVADATGAVALLRGDSLEVERTWRLGAEPAVSAGPVVAAAHVAVVRGRSEVVGLRLDADAVAWRFTPPAAEVVGGPVAAGGRFALADSQGRLWLIDPADGVTTRLILPSPLVAAAAPLPLGADRLLVLLTDGSALAVRLADFTEAPR
jgi:outer membrane protein assembly factor BamB